MFAEATVNLAAFSSDHACSRYSINNFVGEALDALVVYNGGACFRSSFAALSTAFDDELWSGAGWLAS